MILVSDWGQFESLQVAADIAGNVSVAETLLPLTEKSTIQQMAAQLSEAQGMLEFYQSVVKDLTALRDGIRDRILPDKMDNEGIQTIAVRGVGRVHLAAQLRVSTKQGMGPDLKDWMHEHEFDDLITETVNPSTLRAWVKEQMGKGNEVPDHLLNIYPFTQAVLTRA